MDHLTVDEMIRFVSLSKWDEDAMKLSVTVNGHIRKCEKCLRTVRAFQMIYDEFTAMKANAAYQKHDLKQAFEKVSKQQEEAARNYAADDEREELNQ